MTDLKTVASLDNQAPTLGDGVFRLGELLAMEATSPTWSIPGLTMPGDVTMLFAAAGTGKTTLYHEAVVANAEGRPFLSLLDFETEQTILVFDWENSPQQVARSLQRLSDNGGRLGTTYYFTPPLVALDTVEGRQRIGSLAEEHGASVLIFDNRDRAFPNTPELEGDLVSRSMSATKDLALSLGVGIVLVSHEPKTQYAGNVDRLRGHSAWAAFSDQMFNLDWPGGELRRLTHVKNRGVDRLPALRIRRLTEGHPHVGPVKLVAEVDPTGLPKEQSFQQDMALLVELLKDGPLGITALIEAVKARTGSAGKKRLYSVLRGSPAFWQPNGERGPWALK